MENFDVTFRAGRWRNLLQKFWLHTQYFQIPILVKNLIFVCMTVHIHARVDHRYHSDGEDSVCGGQGIQQTGD